VRTWDQTSQQKLRGGFYTPPPLVDICIARAAESTDLEGKLDVLEPSVGDGAFLSGLGRSGWRDRVRSVTAVELIDTEAHRAERHLHAAGLTGAVHRGSALKWALAEREPAFDLAIGNPPFVRFQFVSHEDKTHARAIAARHDLRLAGVANLWIPLLAAALRQLRPCAGFSFVVPTEILHGVSAGGFRRWLLERCEHVQLELFAPRSFPNVLQEVAVLSGRWGKPGAGGTRLIFIEHVHGRKLILTDDAVSPSTDPWTVYLLDRFERQAFAVARQSGFFEPLGNHARFEVSTVTGANDFFCIDDRTRQAFGLEPWTQPLLPRIRHAPGLSYDSSDLEAARSGGARSWLLCFRKSLPDPGLAAGPAAYLREGVLRGLPERYKCRIRTPWYRIPEVSPGRLMLSKRSHVFPRMVVNDAGVRTTDTIYRGRLLRKRSGIEARALTASFHNSLTMLSAELEGRSFGGGVLELVPSEVARLLIPQPGGTAKHFERLDQRARKALHGDALIDMTTDVVALERPLEGSTWELLARAHRRLRDRRLDRNRESQPASDRTGALAA